MVRSYRGSGSASYHAAVVWYPAYATGVFSSRKPESATHGDGLGDLKEMQIFIALAL
jgi:hypothetical protein